MKPTNYLPFVGLAAAVAPPMQRPLGSFSKPEPAGQRVLDTPMPDLRPLFGERTPEDEAIWNMVEAEFPREFAQSNFFSPPKPHTRKADKKWDFITKGEDLQSVWVTKANGKKEREIDGHLTPYSLRTKKVDPSSLGVDKVKQYSGYLDDDENDKHLFYCMNLRRAPSQSDSL
jgi:cathepsin A (carboxypeptidase C)